MLVKTEKGYATLKGVALEKAVDAGLVQSNGQDDYDIGPFLRFWEAFEPIMLAAVEDVARHIARGNRKTSEKP